MGPRTKDVFGQLATSPFHRYPHTTRCNPGGPKVRLARHETQGRAKFGCGARRYPRGAPNRYPSRHGLLKQRPGALSRPDHGPGQTGVRSAAPDSGGVFKNAGPVRLRPRPSAPPHLSRAAFSFRAAADGLAVKPTSRVTESWVEPFR